MLYFLIAILGIILTVFFVIGTHEGGHFCMARLVGVKVLRFSIGFGKTLWQHTDKKGTEYVLALIPLGGYVKMLDESEGDVKKEELHLAYNQQPYYKKFLIVMAGPAVNLLCALLLYWLIFTIGFITVRPVIGEVTPHSIAAQAGLTTKQEIVAIDGEPTATWTSILFRLIAHIGDTKPLSMETRELGQATLTTHTLNLSQWRLDGLKPDFFSSIGMLPYEPKLPLVIGFIAENSAASNANLQLGDKIIALDNKPVKDWDTLMTIISDNPDYTILFTLVRAGKEMKVDVHIGYERSLSLHKTGKLGIGPAFEWPKEFLHEIKYAPLPAFAKAAHEIYQFTYFNLILFGKLATGKLSLQSLGGPITIFESAGSALNYGFLPFIGFLAFLSISIGVINLLPIPGLDGGHLFIQTIEVIIRRPIPDNILAVLYRLGFTLIMMFVIIALMNDVLRLY